MDDEVNIFRAVQGQCLTTEEALFLLKLDIEEIIETHVKDDHVFSFGRMLFSDFLFLSYHYKVASIVSISSIIVLLVLGIKFSSRLEVAWLITDVLEVILAFAVLYSCVYIFFVTGYKAALYPYNELKRMVKSISKVISQLKEDSSLLYPCFSAFRKFSSIDLCPVVRDGKLLSIATCLLVKNDIIYCDRKQRDKLMDIFSFDDLELVNDSLRPGEWNFYRVKVSAVSGFFNNAFDNMNQKRLAGNYYLKNFGELVLRSSVAILVLMIVNILTGVLRFMTYKQPEVQLWNIYKTISCILLIACPAEFLILHWVKVTYVTSALISRLKNVHYVKKTRVSDGFISIIHWIKIWIFHTEDFPYFHYRLAFAIATLKSCICADKDCILTLSHPKPKGLYIFEEANKSKSSKVGDAFRNVVGLNQISGAETRKLSMDSICNMTAIEFENLYDMICNDMKPSEKSMGMKRTHSFSNHLRAIANNVIFNQLCSKPALMRLLESISDSGNGRNASVKEEDMFTCKCSLPLLSQCVNLEKFNINFVSHGGHYLKMLNNSTAKHCVSSFTQPSKFHEAVYVNSFGSVELIIDICSRVFTGIGYASMTPLARKQLKKMNSQLLAQGPCLAFSYKGIVNRQDDAVLSAQRSFSFTFMRDQRHNKAMCTESTSNDKVFYEFSSRIEESISSSSYIDEENLEMGRPSITKIEDILTDIPVFNLSSTISRRVSEEYPGFLKNHIFLGLVSFTSVARKEASDFVQCMLSKYIRFAYFSRENQLLSRNLAISLGLEANWNMFVSLRESDAVSKLHQLPSGIKKVIEHIDLIDDVPLNVNLYTDCTTKTIEEMMDVSMHYNDNFILIGSCLNFSNCGIYLKSSTSFLLLPAIDTDPCIREDEACNRKHPHCYDLSGGFGSNKFHRCIPYNSPLTSLAALIISFGSLLALKKNGYMNIARIVFNARRFLHNLMGSDLLYVFLMIFVNFQYLINIAFLYPPHLSFQNAMWLVLFIFPLLTLGIFMTNRRPELVEDDVSPHPNSPYTNLWNCSVFAVVFIIVPITCIQLFGFQAHLYYSLCLTYAKNNSQCSYFFLELTIHNIRFTEQQADYSSIVWFVQNITTWTITIVISLGSISFISIHTNIFKYKLCNIKRWLFIVFIAIFAESARLLGSFKYYEEENFIGKYLTVIPIYAFINIPVLTIAMIAGIELIKRHHLKKFQVEFRRKHLTYDTRLGMDSPIC